jgi:hypothetical protein
MPTEAGHGWFWFQGGRTGELKSRVFAKMHDRAYGERGHLFQPGPRIVGDLPGMCRIFPFSLESGRAGSDAALSFRALFGGTTSKWRNRQTH